jgi:YVTN family beta-propeller protein
MMSEHPKPRRHTLLILILCALLLPLVFAGLAVNHNHTLASSGLGGTPHYLPLIRLDPTVTPMPTATPIPPPTVPQFVKIFPLPDAECPNAVAFNTTSRYVYIANNFSQNVSVLRDTDFITNIATGFWATQIATDPDSARIFVTVLHDQVTMIENTAITGKVPSHYEPYGAAFNPVNGYTYITDLDSLVQVADGASLIANVSVTDPDTNGGGGWLQPVVVDPTTGLVYFASWSHGRMYVMDGTEVITSYRAGWGVKDMAIDADRGYIYMAHESPNETYPHNISVFNIQTQTITPISTAPQSRAVAVDPLSGYAYVSNETSNSVTVLLGTQVITTLPAGEAPWGVAVNPNSGHAFVTNSASNSVTVYKDGAVVTTIPTQGIRPQAIGIDTTTNEIYIANRGHDTEFLRCDNASVTILR